MKIKVYCDCICSCGKPETHAFSNKLGICPVVRVDWWDGIKEGEEIINNFWTPSFYTEEEPVQRVRNIRFNQMLDDMYMKMHPPQIFPEKDIKVEN